MTILVNGTSYNFTATASTPAPYDGPYTYAWDFGDGTTGTGSPSAKTFSSNGIFRATVTATNSANSSTASASKTHTIIGSETSPPNMITARLGHKSIALNNGKILIVGGASNTTNIGANVALSNCEIYDPVANTFTATGSLNSARCAFTLVKLSNGDILCCGGTVGFYFYLNGNVGTTYSTCEVYSVTNGTWSYTTNPMSSARCFHGANLLPSGKVLVHGGLSSSLTPVNTTEIYDPTAGTWTSGPTLPENKFCHGYVQKYDGSIYIWGGATGAKTVKYVEGVGLSNLSDTLTEQAPSIWAQSFGIAMDTIYAACGLVGSSGFSNAGSHVYTYNTLTDTWSDKGAIAPNGWGGFGVCNNSGLLFGGLANNTTYAGFYSSSLKDLPVTSFNSQFSDCVSIGSGKFLITGGYTSSIGATNSCAIYYVGN